MNPLKQSLTDWCFYKKDLHAPEAYYRSVKAAGFQGVEMAPPERWACAKAAGLQLVNVSGPGMRDGLNRLENHATLLPQIRQLIRQCSENGVGQVIIFSGNRAGQADDQGLRHCITAGKALAGDAQRAKVTLALEVLNGFDHADYQADAPDFAFDFARAVSSPAVKVLYDIYHMDRMNQSPLPDILKNLDLIAHLHVAGSPKRDFPGPVPAPGPAPAPGSGPGQRTDYRSIVAQVHAAGYRGYWGQEFLPAPGGDPIAQARQARELFDSYLVT